jgi:uncharacterized metal-binding protein YceD (DUF177 family)
MAEDRNLQAPSPAVPPELSRPFSIARIGAGARVDVEATPTELAALARRMGIPAIGALTCRFELHRAGGDAVQAHGSLRASVQQICVVTLEPFDSKLAEDFAVVFVPAGTESEEIDPEADDEIGYQGGILDLGEAASEQLALALEPFPRKPGAELPDDLAHRQAGAFAALSHLLPARKRAPDMQDD